MSYGNGFQDQAGQWFWADATAARPWSRAHSNVRMAATLNGLNYLTPFRYSAFTAQLWPSISINPAAFTVTLTPQVTAGAWRADSVSGDISVYGSSLSLSRTIALTTVQLAVEAQRTNQGALPGSFAGATLSAATTVAGFVVGSTVRTWHTPLGHEWGYSAFLTRAVTSNILLTAEAARSVTDPVLATPGSFGASVGFSWRVATQSTRGAGPVAAVGLRSPEGRKVRFTVELANATQVAVSGSFTGWNPIAMQRSGKTFSVELLVPSGTHQYGFLMNGKTWYLPPDAEGIVDDGFGRKNATLVID
ncbi:MAG TPA: glycogen-binding domain-containing protein [Longimicrobiales bacterium]